MRPCVVSCSFCELEVSGLTGHAATALGLLQHVWYPVVRLPSAWQARSTWRVDAVDMGGIAARMHVGNQQAAQPPAVKNPPSRPPPTCYSAIRAASLATRHPLRPRQQGRQGGREVRLEARVAEAGRAGPRRARHAQPLALLHGQHLGGAAHGQGGFEGALGSAARVRRYVPSPHAPNAAHPRDGFRVALHAACQEARAHTRLAAAARLRAGACGGRGRHGARAAGGGRTWRAARQPSCAWLVLPAPAPHLARRPAPLRPPPPSRRCARGVCPQRPGRGGRGSSAG
jgi:hypothetical protein